MAIIIPSSRIYNKQKSVINNNIISRVEIRGKSVSPVIETDATLLSGSYGGDVFAVGSFNNVPTYRGDSTVASNKLSTVIASSIYGINADVSFASVYLDRKVAYASINLRINRNQNNRYVSSFSTENVFSYSVTGKKTTRNASAGVFGYWEKSLDSVSNGNISNISYSSASEEISGLQIQEKIEVRKQTSTDVSLVREAYLYSVIEEKPVFTIREETDDYFSIRIEKIPIKFIYTVLQGATGSFHITSSSVAESYFGNIPISGTETSFVGEKLEININGSRFGIELNETTSVFGSGNFPYTIEGSEIFQEENTYNGKPLNTEITNNLFSSYRNGKETATIRCSIGEYYDENGSLAVSANTERMTFANGDIVVPMVFGAKGKDKPMSLKKDGTPKQFRVVGVRIFYDGAVWQEISLQEV